MTTGIVVLFTFLFLLIFLALKGIQQIGAVACAELHRIADRLEKQDRDEEQREG